MKLKQIIYTVDDKTFNGSLFVGETKNVVFDANGDVVKDATLIDDVQNLSKETEMKLADKIIEAINKAPLNKATTSEDRMGNTTTYYYDLSNKKTIDVSVKNCCKNSIRIKENYKIKSYMEFQNESEIDRIVSAILTNSKKYSRLQSIKQAETFEI